MQLQKSKLKILLLYNGTQLYTSTVYEHVNSFAKHSNHQFFFFLLSSSKFDPFKEPRKFYIFLHF